MEAMQVDWVTYYDERKPEKRKIIPICYSDHCLPKKRTGGQSVLQGAEKDDSRVKDRMCPDCGHAIKYVPFDTVAGYRKKEGIYL